MKKLIPVNEIERMLIVEHPIPVGKVITEYKKATSILNRIEQAWRHGALDELDEALKEVFGDSSKGD